MIFFTNATVHLASRITLRPGTYVSKKFSDGELYVKLEENVENQKVWVVASTAPPADNLLELFFLLDALQRAKAHISLLITYFGYARQDKVRNGESLSAERISIFLKTFRLDSISIIQIHSSKIHDFLPFDNKVPVDIFCPPAQSCEVVVAPDKGSFYFASSVAQACDRESLFVTKMRPEHEKVRITGVHDSVHGKNVLIIDDIISTGTTLLGVAKALKDKGAQKIYAAATHGVLPGNARIMLDTNALIEKIYVTNTLVQDPTYKKIEILDIAPFINQIIGDSKGLL